MRSISFCHICEYTDYVLLRCAFLPRRFYGRLLARYEQSGVGSLRRRRGRSLLIHLYQSGRTSWNTKHSASWRTMLIYICKDLGKKISSKVYLHSVVFKRSFSSLLSFSFSFSDPCCFLRFSLRSASSAFLCFSSPGINLWTTPGKTNGNQIN